MAKNKYLPEDKVLERIKSMREKMAGSEESLRELNRWEKRAKKSLIFLSLSKHEGIQMILDMANEELQEINNRLNLDRPEDAESAEKYALDRSILFARQDLWKWFKQLFVDAEIEIKMIEDDLAIQESDESEAGNPMYDVGS